MKKVLLLTALALISVNILAQERKGYIEKLVPEGNVTGTFRNGDMQTRAYNLRWGYRISQNLHPFVQFEELIGLYKKDGNHDYYKTGNVGIGIGYKLQKHIDANAMVGYSVSDSNWKYTLYEIGVKFLINQHVSETLGIGYRFIDSHTTGLRDHKGFYISLGYRI